MNKVKEAMKVLSDAMKDEGYARAWHANIAVLLTDEGVDHAKAQERAAGFMRLVFGADTSDLYK